MAERKKKGVVAPKYQQTVSRATPQAITALVKKLPAEAGPIEARKKALYDLTLMISNVTQQDQDALLKTSEEHNLVGILATLLKDAEEAEREAEQAGEEATEDADVSAIKVGRKTLGMDYVATKLYVLTLYVNLCFIGGAEQLRNPPTGMELLFDTVLETADESGESGDTLIYYATAGLHNCCLHKSFAECANSKKNAYQRFTELKARCELCPQKEEHGQSPAAQTACPLCAVSMWAGLCLTHWQRYNKPNQWPPVGQLVNGVQAEAEAPTAEPPAAEPAAA